MEVKILADAETLAKAVAEAWMQRATQHQATRPWSVALSGGSTPRALFLLLAKEPYCAKIPWERLIAFFGDERSVPPDHDDANVRMARQTLLDHVPMPYHRMPADTGGAKGYAALLEKHLPLNEEGVPVFDLVLLGIGEDGHTASLFPGTEALTETERWVVMNDVPQLDTQRMTLTFPVINAAREVWVLASGKSKQKVVDGVFQSSEAAAAYPITSVDPKQGNLVWWLDRDATTTENR